MNKDKVRRISGAAIAVVSLLALLVVSTGCFGQASPIVAGPAIIGFITGAIRAADTPRPRPWDYMIDGD